MSMDDQHEQLQAFHRQLAVFNERLRAVRDDLQRSHARVDPLWRDAMRQDYDRIYDPAAARLTDYLVQEAPAYEAFLTEKRAALARYLYGD